MDGDLNHALQVYGRVSGLYPSLEGLPESIRHLRRFLDEFRTGGIFSSIPSRIDLPRPQNQG